MFDSTQTCRHEAPVVSSEVLESLGVVVAITRIVCGRSTNLNQ